MECRRVCHVNGAAGHCRLVEGIPLLQLGEDVKRLVVLMILRCWVRNLWKMAFRFLVKDDPCFLRLSSGKEIQNSALNYRVLQLLIVASRYIIGCACRIAL